MELIKKGEYDHDIDITLRSTAQDFADACTEELANFKPASIVTGSISFTYHFIRV